LWKSEYEKEVFEQKNPYVMWQRKWETGETPDLPEAEKKSACVWIYKEDLFKEGTLDRTGLQGDLQSGCPYAVFVSRNGRPAGRADREVAEIFADERDWNLFYGDEDEWGNEGRCNPWFKPEFSPDTLKSFCYFGNFIAVRSAWCLNKLKECQAEIRTFHDWILYLCEGEERIGHADRILFHVQKGGNPKQSENPQEEVYRFTLPEGKEPKVSVIIPSKDHPEILQRCLKSVKDNTDYPDYEIIVVDNGSTTENKEKTEALRKAYPFAYYYEPMEFNFSAMCNLGAEKASGDVLLFLNDDITAFCKDWMRIMAMQARQKDTGAVGAKLYYPEGNLIQHAGITNMTVGPVHKLGRLCDDKDYYHGRNKAVYNVIAVTAAALAVEKTKYEKVGGFAKELAVAYNDVDFCMALLESGYYNVQRNDAVLYHHESLSRGSDEDEEKRKRLLKERELLYQRHPAFLGKDPYYSRHLVQERLDGEYHVEYCYPHEDKACHSKVSEWKPKKENACGWLRKLLRRGPVMQFCIDSLHSGEMTELEGWLNMKKSPLYFWERSIVLVGEDGRGYCISTFPKLREDTKAVLQEQPCYALSGICARFDRGEIPPGSYRVGVCMTHKKTGKQYVMYDKMRLESGI